MFYNGEPLYKAVYEFLTEKTGHELPICETGDYAGEIDLEAKLSDIGITESCELNELEVDMANHFGFDLIDLGEREPLVKYDTIIQDCVDYAERNLEKL